MKKLCECETSVTSVCMCCGNVPINKKHKVDSYAVIYSYRVNLNLMLICIKLSEMLSSIVNMP